MKRIMIFGAKGQLGRELAGVFADAGEIACWDLPELDITDAGAVDEAVRRFRPTLVVNAAAYTDVEGAEDDRDTAFRVNENGARNVAAASESAGAPVVYYSTDFVFDGTKSEPYEPDDEIAPLGAYGLSKAAGEEAVRGANPRHFVIRTAWLYGPGGGNFVGKILRAASSRPALRVVADEVGSPTHTLDLAAATKALCGTTGYGTYHAVNEGSCSRFEFAKAIVAAAGLGAEVSPCGGSEFPSKARRPSYSVLSNVRLRVACGVVMPDWQEALAAYIERRDCAQ